MGPPLFVALVTGGRTVFTPIGRPASGTPHSAAARVCRSRNVEGGPETRCGGARDAEVGGWRQRCGERGRLWGTRSGGEVAGWGVRCLAGMVPRHAAFQALLRRGAAARRVPVPVGTARVS